MLKLHLGCGKRDFGKDWRHIDREDYDHIDSHDVTVLPYVNGSVDLIYCSHLIAYFDREEIIPVLYEWKRVLKPGGILRIATPDWSVLRRMKNPLLGPLYGKMNQQPIYHKTVYDYTGIKKVLNDTGFSGVKFYNHEKTDHAQYDDHSAAYYKGILISLNVECYAQLDS